jgi:hypothetical protein
MRTLTAFPYTQLKKSDEYRVQILVRTFSASNDVSVASIHDISDKALSNRVSKIPSQPPVIHNIYL